MALRSYLLRSQFSADVDTPVMKVEPKRADAFLAAPGAVKAVLLYGEDEGLVRHRANQVTRVVLGAADDPFRLVWLGRDDHARLEEEATALSLLGGRRVLRVREATDGLAGRLEAVLPQAAALIVLEAGSLAARSKLRAAVEASPLAAAVPCYPEDARALAGTVRSVLDAAGVRADADAVEWLAANLPADREVVRAELEKVALLCGRGGRLDLNTARTAVGEHAALSAEEAALAAAAANVRRADACLDAALADGASPIGVVRAALGHLMRLHRIRVAMSPGQSGKAAAEGAKPKLFFKHVDQYAAALDRWTPSALEAGLASLRAAELACKRTGAADVALARNAVLGLALMASRPANKSAPR